MTKQEFLRRMQSLLDREPETEEEVDAFLRSEGLDPEEIGKRGRTFAEKLLREEVGKHGSA